MTLETRPWITIAACISLLAPLTAGHDDSASYPGSNDDAVTGTYVGSAGSYSAFGAFWPALVCDREVGGDGTSEQEPDETVVDGGAVAIGTVPDATFDDGGDGGACHTRHHDYASYNTPGCLGDTARASDQVLGGAVWIGAGCDYQGPGPTCGADGIVDAINFGTGGAGVAFPSAAWSGSGCAGSDAVMVVVVLTTVGTIPTAGTIWAN